jgi:bifunctional non-homologous end joining protein LigD
VLQNELRGKSTHLVMIAFDLLYLNGYDLRKLPLFERKAHLKKLIEKTDIQYGESFDIDSPTRGVGKRAFWLQIADSGRTSGHVRKVPGPIVSNVTVWERL